MGLLSLFGESKHTETPGREQKPAGKTAPGTTIAYDPRLVPRLNAEHQQLIAIYYQVQDALAHRNFHAVRERLRQFRGVLQEHLLAENVKLYVYLSRQLANDATGAQLVHEMRREMMGIGRTVMDFLRKYADSPIDPAGTDTLQVELDDIGVALIQRIQREESSLYTLYVPNY